MTADLSKNIATLLCVIISMCVACAIWITGLETVDSEAGVVEAMSTLVLAFAVFLFVQRAGSLAARTVYWYATVVLIFLLARECDLDKLMFRQGVFTLKHYTGAAPLWQKVVGLFLVLGLLAALVTLLRRGFVPLVRGIFAFSGWAWLILAAVILLIAGKTLDGLGRKLADVGYTLSVSGHDLAQYIEELAELGAEMCILLAVARIPLGARVPHEKPLRRDHEISSA